jgi:hypothetical protein
LQAMRFRKTSIINSVRMEFRFGRSWRVYYERDALMEAWRKAVIALLRAVLRAGRLRTELTADQMGDLLTCLEKMPVEHENSIVRRQRAFPAIRRTLRKAAAYRTVSDHLDRERNRQVLVQG